MSGAIPFDAIQEGALSQASRLLPEWFPAGRIVRREFKIGNVAGDPGESLSINLDTGLAADFAGDFRGHDLIDVRAAQRHSGDRVAAAREIGAALGLMGAEASPTAENPAKADGNKAKPRIVTTYGYRDADGALLFEICRFEPKDFRQRRPDGRGGWVWNLQGAEPVLFRLPELNLASPDATVYVTEGEKDCDALRERLLIATTAPGGAGKWHSGFTEALRGRRVVILPDHDEAGEKHALAVAAALHGTAASVRILHLPDPPPKGDVSDWLAAGGTAEEMDALADAAPEWTPDPKSEAAPDTALPRIMSAAAFMAGFVPPDYVIDGIVQRGRLYALTSPTGHGKTAVALYVGCMVAAGRDIGAIEVAQGAVIFLAGENPDDLRCRLYAACQAYRIDANDLPLYVLPGNFALGADAAEKLRQDIDALGCNPTLIVVDTAAAFFDGDNDNDNVQMGAYARQLRVLTTCKGSPAVLTPAHPTKAPDRDNLLPRGGGAFLNELDGNLTLWAEAMGETATLHWQEKIRGADFAPVNFALRHVRIDGLADSRGRPIVSIVASLQTDDQAEAASRTARSDENTVLEWLRRHPGIAIKDIAINAGWVAPSGAPHKGKVHRLLLALQRDKLAAPRRGKWAITEAGKKELES